MINTTLFGDCRDSLQLIAQAGIKVQMCVTSPPYFALRDYGHPGQIGFEQTPDEYIAAMVEVFRCVRDVLADDGTLWLNLGSSYASGDKTPNQSPLRQRAPSCDTHGKAPQDFQAADHACLDSCDELQGDTRCRYGSIVRSDQFAEQVEQQTAQTAQGSEHLGCAQSSRQTFQPSDHQSTTGAALLNAPGASRPLGVASACLQETLTSQRNAQACAHKSACTCGTSQMLQPLAVRTKGKESFFSACRRSDCNGIGRCGYCFGSLTIAALNVKQKDELNIPHLVAMALQADGWYLRQDIIWHKPNPMPESVRDRCTKAHEYIFLLSKSERYFFDSEAMREPCSQNSHGSPNINRGKKNEALNQGSGKTTLGKWTAEDAERGRNRRSVWSVATKPYNGKKALTDYVGDDGKPYTASPDCPIHGHLARRQTSGTRGYGGLQGLPRTGNADKSSEQVLMTYKSEKKCTCNEVIIDHFATFPPALIEPCILAGSRHGDIVLDPFMGSGTTAAVAIQHGRRYVGCELNRDYAVLQQNRIESVVSTDLFRQAA